MKSTTLPVFCGIAITAMLAAGASHWWSVRQFVATFNGELPTLPAVTAPASHEPKIAQNQVSESVPSSSEDRHNSSSEDRHKKDFYEALIAKMARVEDQNRDLLDQLAETNRDLMKLEFRIDTHSESFRPLPIEEQSPFSSLENSIGVLPPRAEPFDLPSYE